MKKTNVVLNVTVSGEIIRWYFLPDGSYHNIIDENNILYDKAWQMFNKKQHHKINAYQIVKIEQLEIPCVNIEIIKKHVSKWYRFLWEGNMQKLYDVKITKNNTKTITSISLSNGETLLVDEDISIIENAINSLNL